MAAQTVWPPFAGGFPASPAAGVLPPGARLSPVKAAAVVLPADMLPEAARFFTEVLGLKAWPEKSGGMLLAPASGQTGILLIGDPGAGGIEPQLVGAPNRLGLRHLAFLVEGDLPAFARQVSQHLGQYGTPARGGEALTVSAHQTKQLVYFQGPGGVLLELMQYRGKDIPPPGAAADASPGAGIAAIDHLNIVTKDITQTLIFMIQGLGFAICPGRHGRLCGGWIDKLTGQKNVDAYYIALKLPGGCTNVELIQYQSPPPLPALSQAGPAGQCGLVSLAFTTANLNEFEAHVRNQAGDEISICRAGLDSKAILIETPDGVRFEISAAAP